jgi:hypothetical protein
MLEVGKTVRFAYHNRMRTVKIEKMGRGYITGCVLSENNVPKSFRVLKMSSLLIIS